MSDCFRCSFLSRGKKVLKVLKVCGLSIQSLSKEQKAQEYELFHQVSLEMSSWCVQRLHITTEPPQCQLFRNPVRRLLFLAQKEKHFSCYPNGSDPRALKINSAWKRTINEMLHLPEENMIIIEKLKVMRFFAWQKFDRWKKHFYEHHSGALWVILWHHHKVSVQIKVYSERLVWDESLSSKSEGRVRALSTLAEKCCIVNWSSEVARAIKETPIHPVYWIFNLNSKCKSDLN